MTNRNEAQLIALDWGTSVCRAYLLGENGVVLAETREPSGIMTVAAGVVASEKSYAQAFDQTFELLCEDWLIANKGLPVIACGMIGSNHGWAETEYRRIPADLAESALSLTSVRTRIGTTLKIIPGLIADTAIPDVMRGEETQILGALTESTRAGAPDADRVVVLPGTHSKWVRVDGTIVTDFTTFMTGEFYAWLTTDSTVSRLATRAEAPDWDAFDRGLDVVTSLDGRRGVLSTAFSARTLVMTGNLDPQQVDDYISGLLIGHELAGAFASWLGAAPADVLLCGDADLSDRYRRAMERLGLQVTIAGSYCAPAGMWHVAQAAGLVRGAAEGASPVRSALLADEALEVEGFGRADRS